MRTRTLVVVGVLVALLLAGVASYYASRSPDGLNRVAHDQGFSRTAEEHRAQDGPLAGYRTRGVDDARLSRGVAGVLGSLVVLTVAGGVAFGLRRRSAGSRPDAPSAQER